MFTNKFWLELNSDLPSHEGKFNQLPKIQKAIKKGENILVTLKL